MKPQLTGRFWTESALASASALLLAVTVIWKDWIEIAFGVDPDRGSGAIEWLIVSALLIATLACSALARYEWRRVANSPS
jgi:DMSO/TMAO reductase YedYZ heme-binding membrane subunit